VRSPPGNVQLSGGWQLPPGMTAHRHRPIGPTTGTLPGLHPRLHEETERLELRVIEVDIAMTEDDLAKRVTEAFGL
jgi:hypothetical protein